MLFGDFSDWLFIVKVVTVVYSAHAKNDSTYALPWRLLLLPLIASRRRENPSSLLYGARAYFCCNISCCNIFCCIPTIFLLHPGKRCLKFLLLALKSQHWNMSHIIKYESYHASYHTMNHTTTGIWFHISRLDCSHLNPPTQKGEILFLTPAKVRVRRALQGENAHVAPRATSNRNL